MSKKALICIMAAFMLIMSACAVQKEIDKACYEKLTGDYQAVEQASDNDEEYVGAWWHLYIGESESGTEYLTIYDNGAGNPGVEGDIITLNQTDIVISYDEELFEQLPSGLWEVSDGRLAMGYDLTDRGIELTNNGHTILFKKEGLPEVVSGHWKSEDSKCLDKILFENDQVCIEGWNMNDDGIWDDVPTSFFLAYNCTYVDNYNGGGVVSQEDFEKLLAGDNSRNSVIELVLREGEISEIRLVGNDESRFAE